MSGTVDLRERIGDAAARHRGLAEVFDELDLDYACHGSLTIAEALREAKCNTPQAIARIEHAASRPAGPHWIDKPLSDVIDFIEREHHDVVRGRLFAIATRVSESLRTPFRELSEALIEHIEREELTVFPVMIALEEAWVKRTAPPPRIAGGMRAVTTRLSREQVDIAQRLCRIRHASEVDDVRFRTRLDSLARHIHQYIGLENYVVFPRAVALDDCLYENTKEDDHDIPHPIRELRSA